MTRPCGHCGNDISHRPKNARYCEDESCRIVRQRAAGLASYYRHHEDIRERRNTANAARRAAAPPAPRTPRACAYCGTDISDRASHNAKWCDLRCRDKFRYGDRAAHRWNVYAARVQRDAGLPVDPPIPESTWALLLPPGALCAYCGDPGTEPDHVVALSRGGRHDQANIVPACRPCNRSKRSSLPDQWRGRRGLASIHSDQE